MGAMEGGQKSDAAELARMMVELGKDLGRGIDVPIRIPGQSPVRFVPNAAGEWVPIGFDTPMNPDRIRQKLEIRDLTAFCRYVNEFKFPGPCKIFAVGMDGSTTSPRFTAILDYHMSGAASWATHHAVLSPTSTAEFKTWWGGSGKLMGQEEFALFIEEHQVDIVRPSGADMLELATSLHATQEAAWESRVRLDNGDVVFGYRDATRATAGQDGKLTIPETFTIKVEPFVGVPEQAIECRFRYAFRRPSLQLGYVIPRKEQLIRGLMRASADIIKVETGCEVIEGELK